MKIDQYKEVTEDVAVFRLESPAATELGARLEEQAVSTYAIAADKISLYVDAAGLAAFLDDVCAKVDASILADPSSTHALADTLVDALLNYAVDEAGNTVIGLVDYAYQTHLRGSESCEEWAEAVIAKVAGGEGNAEGLLMEVLRSSVNTAQPELVSLAREGEARYHASGDEGEFRVHDDDGPQPAEDHGERRGRYRRLGGRRQLPRGCHPRRPGAFGVRS